MSAISEEEWVADWFHSQYREYEEDEVLTWERMPEAGLLYSYEKMQSRKGPSNRAAPYEDPGTCRSD